ncbi:peptidase domain-containing ABC transporter [Minwuia sp.]|uniref:peptidase domain-containing ABC transporter n=1 Tax=Minwuia sp. TaxID=2493630 RepID=UPI003A943CF5
MKKTSLRSLIGPIWPATGELLVLSLFINLMALAVPVFVLQVYDRVVAKAGLTTLQGLAIGVAVVIVFDFLLRQTRSRVVQRASLRFDLHFGKRLFEKLNRLPLRVLESRPAAYWQGLFRDSDTVRNAVAGPPVIMLVDLPFAVLFLGIIYIIAEPLVWVILCAAGIFVLFALLSGLSIGSVARKERDNTINRDGFLADIVANRTTIKALSLERAVTPMWEGRQVDAIEGSMDRGRVTDTFGNIGVSLTVSTTIAITTVGALAIIDQQISIGSLVATNMLASRIVGPFAQLVSQWRNMVMARQSGKRLVEVLAMADDHREVSIELPRPEGAVTVENVTFAFDPNAEPVLKDIRIRIPARGVHAIVGPNGSGKTTLLKLIQGLYAPQKGRMLLDGADISQFTVTQMANWIGYVPQENVLLAGTIRENLARGRDDVDDDDILQAAKSVGAHDFIVDLPDGYGTVVGEGGRTLSGGQRQRLAIARALIGDPAVLLMDEPSASLDRAAEEQLRDQLRTLAERRTVLIVSHSATLLAVCTNIVVMDKGVVVRGGPAKDILPTLFRRPAPPAAPAPAQPPAENHSENQA